MKPASVFELTLINKKILESTEIDPATQDWGNLSVDNELEQPDSILWAEEFMVNNFLNP